MLNLVLNKKPGSKKENKQAPAKTAADKEDEQKKLLITAAKEAAKKSVAFYDSLRADWEKMKKDFEQNFPEAAAELTHIMRAEDAVVDAIAEAKKDIGIAKISIGDFRCQLKFSQPGYDAAVVAHICVEQEDKDLLFDLIERSVIKKITFDNKAAKLFFDRDSARADQVAKAWKEKVELTPSVFTPKIG